MTVFRHRRRFFGPPPPDPDATSDVDVFHETDRPPRSGHTAYAAAVRLRHDHRPRPAAVTFRRRFFVIHRLCRRRRRARDRRGRRYQHRVTDRVTRLAATAERRFRVPGPDEPHAKSLAQVDGPAGVRQVPVTDVHHNGKDAPGTVVRHSILDRRHGPEASRARVRGVGLRRTVVRRTVRRRATMAHRGPDGRQTGFLKLNGLCVTRAGPRLTVRQKRGPV